MSRTPKEIRSRIDAIEDRDILGWSRQLLIGYLPFEHAKPFLKDGVTEAQWNPEPLDSASVQAHMRDYMSFAWEKCLGERGISAKRSVDKMAEWLWLLGDEEAMKFAQDGSNYPMYGAPVLRYICERYAFPIPEEVRA